MDQLDALNQQEQNAQDLYQRQLDDYYTQLQQKQKDLAALKKSLEDARYSYTQAVNPADRQRMAPGILDKEKRVNELQKEISSLTVKVRNTEIKAIKHL